MIRGYSMFVIDLMSEFKWQGTLVFSVALLSFTYWYVENSFMLFIIILLTVLLFLINIIGTFHINMGIPLTDVVNEKRDIIKKEIISHIITIAAFYLATQLVDKKIK